MISQLKPAVLSHDAIVILDFRCLGSCSKSRASSEPFRMLEFGSVIAPAIMNVTSILERTLLSPQSLTEYERHGLRWSAAVITSY